MEHGSSQYRKGCRCDICRTANTEVGRRYRERKYAARGFGPITRDPSKHGTRSRYLQGCRCDLCRNANTLGSRAWRARPIEDRYISHGRNGYSSGCRCDICSVAHRDYMRVYMRQRRANLAVINGGKDGQDAAAPQDTAEASARSG